MLKYLKGYRATALAAPFMKLAEALMELYIPLLVRRVIDDGIGGNDKRAVLVNCGLIALLGVLGMLFSVISQWFSARAAVGFSCALRRDLFAKAVRIGCADADGLGQSAMITRLTSDTDKIQSGINMGLRLLLRSPFVVFGSVVMAFTVSRRIGLYFLAAVCVLSAVVFAIVYGGIPLQSRASKKLEAVTRRTRDNLHGVRIIRAFGAEARETAIFDEANAAQEKAAVRAGRLSSFLNPLTFSIVNLAIIAVLYRGTLDVSTGALRQGEVVALYNYMAQILTELVKLATLTVTLSKALACSRRVKKVLELPDDAAGSAKDAAFCDDAVLEFSHVSFRYGGASEDSLSDISFVLRRGESLGILGGTGAGKSTLVSLIPGLYRPTSGTVKICGKDTAAMAPADIRRRVSAVPQKARLFAGTVADNIRLGREDATDSEVRDALRAAAALDFVEAKENGIEEAVLRDGSNFSGGQKQRLTIARALIRQTDILVLDDCLSALDYKTDREVRRGIASLRPKPVCVIVSQRPSAVLQCDRILVLEDGKAVGLGTHGELYGVCGEYTEIYDSQYGGKEENNG